MTYVNNHTKNSHVAISAINKDDSNINSNYYNDKKSQNITKSKKIEEEKNAPPDANKDKSKSSIIKDISKENESQKENPRTQRKIIKKKKKTKLIN